MAIDERILIFDNTVICVCVPVCVRAVCVRALFVLCVRVCVRALCSARYVCVCVSVCVVYASV